jgi:hypothetical protein
VVSQCGYAIPTPPLLTLASLSSATQIGLFLFMVCGQDK